jgi:hypothetical protein
MNTDAACWRRQPASLSATNFLPPFRCAAARALEHCHNAAAQRHE